MTLLTKSKYMLGLQCPKLLWTIFNDKDKIPKPDASTQHKFDQGNQVGELAKKLFPEGINIEFDDFMGSIRKSKESLSLGKPLFEPGFMKNNLYARADILVPVGDEWDIIEVKSSTKVKDENMADVSFQKYVYELSGLKIRKCYLMYINNKYVKNGEIDPKEFFIKEEIEVDTDIKEQIDIMFEIISRKELPKVNISKQCSIPYECAIHEDCWSFLPKNNVFDLYRGGKKSFELFENGCESIKEIPDDFKLTSNQDIQKQCEQTGNIHINKEGIKQFLDTLEEPLYYLDFETFSTAVPIYDGTRPYQQIPFQFSLHVGGEHISFLAKGDEDPREEFAKKLRESLGKSGSIVVYNQSFEIARLKELAVMFPEYKEWVETIIARVADLLVPFRNFDYYNPSQYGSASIKKVLPAITEKSYDGMGIDNGVDASLAFLDIVMRKIEDVEKVRCDLEKYCCLDTEGMIWIVDELKKIVK